MYWQERSRSFPAVARVFPSRPVANQTDHGRGLAVAEAQAVLQRRLVEVEFLRSARELLSESLSCVVEPHRALAVRVHERLSSS